MGPQKAVVMAVSRPTTTNSILRIWRVLIPKLSAYCGPKSRMFSGFTNKKDAIIPIKQRIEKRGI